MTTTSRRNDELAQAAQLAEANAKWYRQRAEVAEARVVELQSALAAAERERDDANIEAALEQSNARDAWQRAAELEATLAAERDAHQWRPVSTVPLEQEVLLLVCGEVEGPPGHQWICTYDAPFSGWRPIPLPPQEPTQ